MDFNVCVLSSGSTGNAVLVSAGEQRILVDAGLSARRITELLGQLSVPLEQLRAIVITHEHGDHVQGVGALARKLKVPVLATPETLRAGRNLLGKLPEARDIYPGRPVVLGDLTLLPFPTFHDAACAVAFVIKHADRSLGIATDIGHFSNLAFHRLTGCATVVLEANYDPTMLKDGPYPWHLKQRISSRHGHLSNLETCRVIEELSRGGLKRVLLSHLSQTNNHPDVVIKTLVDRLPEHVIRATEFHLTYPDKPSAVVPV